MVRIPRLKKGVAVGLLTCSAAVTAVCLAFAAMVPGQVAGSSPEAVAAGDPGDPVDAAAPAAEGQGVEAAPEVAAGRDWREDLVRSCLFELFSVSGTEDAAATRQEVMEGYGVPEDSQALTLWLPADVAEDADRQWGTLSAGSVDVAATDTDPARYVGTCTLTFTNKARTTGRASCKVAVDATVEGTAADGRVSALAVTPLEWYEE